MLHSGTLLTVAAGTLLAMLDAGLVSAALPSLAVELGASHAAVARLMPAVVALVSGVLLIAGRLADVFGHRRVFLTSTVLYTAAALGSGFMATLMGVTAMRIAQAIGAAGILAAGPALVTAVAPPFRRGLALGLLASAGALGFLGAMLWQHWVLPVYTWPTTFWLLGGMGAGVALAAWLLMPADTQGMPRRPWFDLQGTLLIVLTAPAIWWAIYLGGEEGLRQLEPLALAFGGLVGLLWLLRVERETNYPVLDFSLFQNGRFTGALLAGTLSFILLFSVIFILPLYMVTLQRASPGELLLYFAIAPGAMLVLSPFSGIWGDRWGTRGVCVAALGALSAVTLWAAELTADTPIWQVALQMALIAAAWSVFHTANNSAIMGSVPARQLGTASALLGLSRHTGMVLGGAIATALFRLRFEAETGHGLHDFTAGSTIDTDAFAAAMRLALHVAAAVAAPAVLASLMKNRGSTQEPPTLF